MRRLIVAALGAILAWPALAASSVSDDEQRQACMGDAFRLCLTDIPDRAAVRLCLAAKRAELTSECRSAYDRVVASERKGARTPRM